MNGGDQPPFSWLPMLQVVHHRTTTRAGFLGPWAFSGQFEAFTLISRRSVDKAQSSRTSN
jgi:hypothetical protein